AEVVRPIANRIKVDLALEHRRKGLVWYPTYSSDFEGAYRFVNPGAKARSARIVFQLPAPRGTYDRFSVTVDGKPREATVDASGAIVQTAEVGPGKGCEFKITYRTRGMRTWRYRPAGGLGQVTGLELVATTDFRNVDFPDDSLSPMKKERTAGGTMLTWSAEGLITAQTIGVVMPEKLNPGPLAARMTFFAPVCLFFFFVLVGTVNIVCRVSIHPMHYLFVAAGFFAFHLFFAYLVDHANVHLSFWMAALTAVALVTLYLRSALGGKFPWPVAFGGQICYLVLFSYTFFLKGMTGLAVTVGSIITLAVLMTVTAKIDWFRVFGGHSPEEPEIPVAPLVHGS
ncbi:MAG: inner membrane CreD family protein, partial [Planctomycetota bacterium]